MKNKPFVSIIIPIERKTKYLEEALNCFSKQTYQDFEVIIASSAEFSTQYSFARVIVDKKLSGDVASKRNQILKFGRGEIFVFNDDDVFTPVQYLERIVRKLKNPKILALCGPLLTPPKDSFCQQASGAVWESYMGSLGAGVYRSRKFPARMVYDYPAANLIVRKKTFEAVGGFEKELYPGEDTKLCLDIFNKYQKGIVYDPSLFVHHHRKALFKPHLVQIGRYGKQRGWFTLSYPETSLKLLYFLPSFFLVYILSLIFISFKSYITSDFSFPFIIILPLLIYLSLLAIEGVEIVYRKGILAAGLAVPGIFLTHLYYGYKFAKSFTAKIILKAGGFLKLTKKL